MSWRDIGRSSRPADSVRSAKSRRNVAIRSAALRLPKVTTCSRRPAQVVHRHAQKGERLIAINEDRLPPRDNESRVRHGLGRRAPRSAQFQAEDVAGEMEGGHLAAAVREQPHLTHRPTDDLVRLSW